MRRALNSLPGLLPLQPMIDFQEALLQLFRLDLRVGGQGPDGTWSSKFIRQHYSSQAYHVLQVPKHVRMQARKERHNAHA